ncbi:MAG: nucleotide sugar dehydrogenase [bacterium]|nr:nucleotide sugar dehydrogenase [bacterium]
MEWTNDLKNKKECICLIGLGYVGLPLAVLFSRCFKVIGFDINEERIRQLKEGHDHTDEIPDEQLRQVKDNLILTSKEEEIKKAKLIIVTVPTPIDTHKIPDLTPVESATRLIGRNLTRHSVVVYESTVYPGVTREICVPILEKESGLKWLKDFNVGYSPERINPGDKEHSVSRIVKIVSGDTEETCGKLGEIYGEVITAGLFRASSIEVAEAAKVIENTQRDLNIALVNELSIIFHKLGIDTREVLDAAGTKWNFLKFQPGLVGGHCIGVDPYYLASRAEEMGYHPDVIMAGRRINDYMGKYIAEETVKLLIQAGYAVKDSRIAVLGLTFKENVPDIRNSRVLDIIGELKKYGVEVMVTDAYADPDEVRQEYGVELVDLNKIKDVDGVVVAVAHRMYQELQPAFFRKIIKGDKKILVDVKGIYHNKEYTEHFLYWCL